MPSSALLASRARARATTGRLSPRERAGSIVVVGVREPRARRGSPPVSSPVGGNKEKSARREETHRPGVMFKRLFGAKDADGGGAAPTAEGRAGGKTPSVRWRSSRTCVPRPHLARSRPPRAESARNIASNGTRLVSPMTPRSSPFSQTLSMLEKREELLNKKMALELQKAKEFNRAKNKRAALQCLKRKKLYEQQIENLQNHRLKLDEQVITLEGSKTTAETFSALKSSAGAMKQLHKETNIDEVDRVMDDINEQSEKIDRCRRRSDNPWGTARTWTRTPRRRARGVGGGGPGGGTWAGGGAGTGAGARRRETRPRRRRRRLGLSVPAPAARAPTLPSVPESPRRTKSSRRSGGDGTSGRVGARTARDGLLSIVATGRIHRDGRRNRGRRRKRRSGDEVDCEDVRESLKLHSREFDRDFTVTLATPCRWHRERCAPRQPLSFPFRFSPRPILPARETRLPPSVPATSVFTPTSRTCAWWRARGTPAR